MRNRFGWLDRGTITWRFLNQLISLLPFIAIFIEYPYSTFCHCWIPQFTLCHCECTLSMYANYCHCNIHLTFSNISFQIQTNKLQLSIKTITRTGTHTHTSTHITYKLYIHTHIHQKEIIKYNLPSNFLFHLSPTLT